MPKQGKPPVISLRPVSIWKGRLSAAEPKYARGWQVKAWTRVGGDPNAGPATTGYVETTTDNEGRFALAPIAVGGLQLQLKPPGDLPVLADIPRVPGRPRRARRVGRHPTQERGHRHRRLC